MSFLSGFARSLEGSMAKESDAAREMEKQRMLMELKKKYEAEIVRADLTTIEGNIEKRRNQFGDVISERELSPEEAEVRKAEIDKLKAATRSAIAGADSAEFEVENQDEILGLDMEAKRANIAQSRASAAASAESAATSRFNRSRAQTEDGRKVMEAAAELDGVLASIETDDSVSDSAQAAAIRAELSGVLDTVDDPDELRRQIIKLKAQAGRINSRAKTLDSTRPGSGGSGSEFMDLIRQQRALDGGDDDENFSVVPGRR